MIGPIASLPKRPRKGLERAADWLEGALRIDWAQQYGEET